MNWKSSSCAERSSISDLIRMIKASHLEIAANVNREESEWDDPFLSKVCLRQPLT